MIKWIAVLISCGLSLLTIFNLNINQEYLYVIYFVLFFIVYLLGLIIIFFIPLFWVQLFVKADFEVKHYNKRFHKMYIIYTTMLLSLFGIKLIVNGKEKIPTNTTFVVAHNHLSNLDPIILNVYFKKYPMVFMAKKSLSKIPFFGKMIKRTGFIFLERDGSTKDAYAIARGIKMLRNDECSIGIAPEGTRNFTNEILLPFKEGTFVLAQKARKPIVVTAFANTNIVNDNLLFKSHKIYLEIIDVLEYDDYKDLTSDELSQKVFDLMYEYLKDKRVYR